MRFKLKLEYITDEYYLHGLLGNTLYTLSKKNYGFEGGIELCNQDILINGDLFLSIQTGKKEIELIQKNSWQRVVFGLYSLSNLDITSTPGIVEFYLVYLKIKIKHPKIVENLFCLFNN